MKKFRTGRGEKGENSASVESVDPVVEEPNKESVEGADESMLDAEEYEARLNSLNQRMIELKEKEEKAYKELFGTVPDDILPSNREAYFKEFPKELRWALDQKLSELEDEEKEIEERKPLALKKEKNDKKAEDERIKKEKSDQLIEMIRGI